MSKTQTKRFSIESYKTQFEEVYEARLRPSLIKRLSIYAIGFVRRTGVKVVELESGRVLCRMPLKGNVNHIKTMYAGALFTLAEFPGGPLMLATFGIKRFIPIVTSLDLDFVKAAKTDVTIELTLTPAEIERIERETLEQGKSEFVVDGELKDLDGNVVARSRATYQMRPKRR
ncbi:MAG: PaaI family thioesterase [Nevskiales bacterium]